MEIGHIQFAPVSRVRFTTDPSVRRILPVLNENAAAIVQLQEVVSGLRERISALEEIETLRGAVANA